jgi:hypothetical protein
MGIMKQSQSTVFAIALLVCIVYYGCTSDDSSNPTSSNISFLAKGDGFVSPSVTFNSSNPYDSIGLIHNEAIIWVLNHVSDTATMNDSLMLSDTLISRLNIYFVDNGYISAQDIDQREPDATTFLENHWDDIDGMYFLTNYTNDTLSSVEVEYLNRIGNVFSGGYTVTAALDSIDVIEQDICNTTWQGNGGNYAYPTVSVAKYSINLWKGISDQMSNEGGSVLTDAEILSKAACDVRIVPKFIEIRGEKIYVGEDYEIDRSSIKKALQTAVSWLGNAIKTVGSWLD